MTRDPLTGTALPMAPAAGRVHLLEDDEDRTTERQGRRWTKPNDKQLVILQLLAKADEGLRGREIIERSNGLFDQTSLHSATVRLRSEKLIASKGKTNGITWFILPAGLKALEQAESDDAKPAPVKQRAPKVTIKADVVPAPAAPRPATDTFAAAISAEGDLLIFEAPPGRSAYEATPIVIQRAHARLLAQYLRRLPISHEFNV